VSAVSAYRVANGLSAVTDANITCPGYAGLDIRASKTFPLGGARSFEVLFQAFNSLNRVNYSASVVGNAVSPSFGQVLSAQPARQVELAGRFRF
jgi:hypothetical protein